MVNFRGEIFIKNPFHIISPNFILKIINFFILAQKKWVDKLIEPSFGPICRFWEIVFP